MTRNETTTTKAGARTQTSKLLSALRAELLSLLPAGWRARREWDELVLEPKNNARGRSQRPAAIRLFDLITSNFVGVNAETKADSVRVSLGEWKKPAENEWPKFKISDRTTNEVRIAERAETEALFLKLMKAARLDKWDRKYAKPAQVKKTIDQLASGSILGVEPRGSHTNFQRYTLEDSIRDAAVDLFDALNRCPFAVFGLSKEGKAWFDTFAKPALAKADRSKPQSFRVKIGG